MKQTAPCLGFGLALALLLSGCAKTSPEQMQAAADDAAKSALIGQTAAGVLWTQQSGEYRALAYQAFNVATVAYDQAKVKKGQKKAVVVDLDETMIDNSPHAAWQVLNGKTFNPDTWTKWVEAKEARAIPGAVEFAHHVVNRGGKVYYVSNRKTGAEYQPTVDNLKALGFPDVTEQTLLLKEKSSNKDERFAVPATQGYTVVLYVGDNLGDFAGEPTYRKSNADRRAFVDAHRADFGVKYVVLPNPTYGDWEGGLADGYYKLTPQEQENVRRSILDAWKP
ncbi:MAG: 5'-nucleotidase, lipoprotein e(P4) family [Cardiobacteriaceae bacterium]|nr:5'-nucleotidase, lipoprotein e(P4) family [Cardiobacteriaceae bacterium]